MVSLHVQDSECALVARLNQLLPQEGSSEEAPPRADPEDYDVTLIIRHEMPGGSSGAALVDTQSLCLRYWVILTNRKEMFPKDKLEQKIGVLKKQTSRMYSASKSYRRGAVMEEGGGGNGSCMLPSVKNYILDFNYMYSLSDIAIITHIQTCFERPSL